DLTTADIFVKANGLKESSTIVAIVLVSMAREIVSVLQVQAALIVWALVCGGAVVASKWIPTVPAARPGRSWRVKPITQGFF
ncbi:MFS transporter, partial [Klebsiella pneumoniae]|nr:MFS transporter [Klebsiella pneumoniae]